MSLINKDSISSVTQQLADTLIKKNHDYGNSVQEQFNEYGLTSVLIRLDDKMRRLKTLSTLDPKVVEESLEDTLQDLAGYALLGLLCVKGMETIKPLDLERCQRCGKVLKQNALHQSGKLFCSAGCYELYETTRKPPYADIDDN